MSKARARERAKARAGTKPKKKEDPNRKLDRQNNHKKFENKDFSIKGPSGNTNASSSGAAKRGAARSG
tara:strand:+ start:371 stop:574 length:204 start_codon:yes stop_codon:yes gene_type:complete